MVRRLTGRKMDSTFQFRARQATVSGLVRDRAKRRGAAVSSKHCQLWAEKSVCRAEIRRAAAHRRMRRRHQGRVVSTSNPSPVRALASRASRDRRNGPSAQNLARCGRIARPDRVATKLIVISPATGPRPGDVHQTITAERTVCAQTRLRPDLSSRARRAAAPKTGRGHAGASAGVLKA